MAAVPDDLFEANVAKPQSRILDGRNRLAACRLAGVEPTFTTYDGPDADGYALAVNIARRHLSKGQKAMIVATVGKVNRSEVTQSHADEVDVDRGYVAKAQVVLRHAEDLAPLVVDGALPLSEAYERALRNRREAEVIRARKIRLRDGAPDLLGLVDEERMSLNEAVAALETREAEEQAKLDEAERRARDEERKRLDAQRDARALLLRAVDLVAPANASPDFAATWLAQLGEVDIELGVLLKRAGKAADVLTQLAKGAKQQ